MSRSLRMGVLTGLFFLLGILLCLYFIPREQDSIQYAPTDSFTQSAHWDPSLCKKLHPLPEEFPYLLHSGFPANHDSTPEKTTVRDQYLIRTDTAYQQILANLNENLQNFSITQDPENYRTYLISITTFSRYLGDQCEATISAGNSSRFTTLLQTLLSLPEKTLYANGTIDAWCYLYCNRYAVFLLRRAIAAGFLTEAEQLKLLKEIGLQQKKLWNFTQKAMRHEVDQYDILLNKDSYYHRTGENTWHKINGSITTTRLAFFKRFYLRYRFKKDKNNLDLLFTGSPAEQTRPIIDAFAENFSMRQPQLNAVYFNDLFKTYAQISAWCDMSPAKLLTLEGI